MPIVRRCVLMLACAAGLSLSGHPLRAMDAPAILVAHPAPGEVQLAAEPNSPRVGRVRRNAQGEIELVPDTPPALVPQVLPPAPTETAPPSAAAPARAPVRVVEPPRGLPPASTLSAPVESKQPAAAARVATWPTCEGAVLLCMQVNATADTEQTQVPVTFGHPLAAALLAPGQRVAARYEGAILPVQLDQVARHGDGSIRFAVFSTVLPRLAAQAQAKLEIVKDSPPAAAPPAIASAAPELKVELETYASQFNEIVIGSPNYDPGIGFKAGERITLALGEPAETVVVTIAPDMEGPGLNAFTKISLALAEGIARTASYRAIREGHWLPQGLYLTSKAPEGRAFPVRLTYAGAAKIFVREMLKGAPRQRYVATLAPGAAGTPWLDGPVAREVYAHVPLRAASDGREHPALSVLVGVRRYAGSDAVRFDVAIDNTSIQVDELRNYTYDAVLRVGGAQRYELKGLEHFAMSRWHRLLWAGQPPRLDTIHDRTLLLQSRALPPYDPDLRVSSGAIGRQIEQLRRANTGPMGNAFIIYAFGTTGGRADIGPLPAWSALHALSLDPRLAAVVLANADASGSVPIHLTSDPRAGTPMNVKQFPATRNRDGRLNLPNRTLPFGWIKSPFSPDTAHQPSLTFYPYLLTGDRFYLDELHHWVSYNALVMPPDVRQGGLGILFDEQVRGQAWALRSLAHAALFTAEQHPMKPVFQEQLKANMAAYLKRYVTGVGEGGPGVNHVIADDQREKVAPWQQDMMAIVVAHLAENGVEGAEKLARWMSRFVVGRWNAEAQGYCRANAPGYWLRNDGGKAITWADFNRLNWPDQRSCVNAKWLDPDPDCTFCYTTIARAALASMLNLGIAEAREPYDFVRQRSPNARADLASDPTFALAPRKP